jgi:uncharacterized protein YdhG (YjbR/CyaY superfamily)
MEKAKKQIITIDEYISTFPSNVQAILRKFKDIIQEAAPQATEAIKYQMPTFVLNDTNLIHFAAYKNHIGLYPTPSGINAFQKELKNYVTSKGAIQFVIAKSIPYDLVRRITEFRVKEVEKK